MFSNDSQDKAEKKLLLLHLFNKMDYPLTNLEITDFAASIDLMDYFTLQQYLGELVDGSMLEYSKSGEDFFYLITAKGKESLEYFKGRLIGDMVESLNGAISDYKKKHAIRTRVLCGYSKKSDSEYIVDLKVMENELTLMDLQLSVVSNRQAKEICDRWKTKSTDVYGTIMSMLIDGEEMS